MILIRKALKSLLSFFLALFMISPNASLRADKAFSTAVPAGFSLFPATNIWNTPVDQAPIHPKSGLWMDVINGHAGHNLKADFGYMYNGHYNGIPYNVVGNATPKVKVAFNPAGNYSADSDPLPANGLPIPADFLIEGDPIPVDLNTDRHLLLLDTDNHVLHEMFAVVRAGDGTLLCSQYSRWNLNSNNLRADQLSSADAAGLPILPGLVRWDEIQSGEIKHALRFTLALTWKPHIWPARHDAASGSANNPPMGMRVRLKANFDISHYSNTNQIILKALKKYGMFMADNGGDWYISGAPDPHFDDDDLHLLGQIIPHDAFEVVDTSSWMVDPNTGQVAPGAQRATGVGTALTAVQVYPNPWRSDRHVNRPVTFDKLPGDATVKIFTVSGHLVKSIPDSGTTVTWDRTNNSGDAVASGLYVYLVKTSDGQSTHGELAIIR